MGRPYSRISYKLHPHPFPTLFILVLSSFPTNVILLSTLYSLHFFASSLVNALGSPSCYLSKITVIFSLLILFIHENSMQRQSKSAFMWSQFITDWDNPREISTYIIHYFYAESPSSLHGKYKVLLIFEMKQIQSLVKRCCILLRLQEHQTKRYIFSPSIFSPWKVAENSDTM